MSKNLKLRIMTALIGAPLILALLFGLGVEGVAIVAWVISCGMWFEFSKMFFTGVDRNEKTAFVLVLTSLVHACHYWLTVGISGSVLGLFPLLIFSIFFLLQVPRILHYRGAEQLNTPDGIAALGKQVNELTAAVFGFVYCTWFPLLMVSIRQEEEGQQWLGFLLLAVWSADSFAYFAGSKFGKHKLFESVSPKKSWEGAAGGLIGAVVITQIYGRSFLPHAEWWGLIVISLALGVASVFGDLVESLLKRATDCKDSGNLLPGHGGFLDRFDGVVFALPVMYMILRAADYAARQPL